MVCARTKEKKIENGSLIFDCLAFDMRWCIIMSWLSGILSFRDRAKARDRITHTFRRRCCFLKPRWPTRPSTTFYHPFVCNFEKWGPIVFLRKATIMVANEDNFYFSQTTSPLCIFRRIVNDTGSRTRFLEGYLFWMAKPSTNKSQ